MSNETKKFTVSVNGEEDYLVLIEPSDNVKGSFVVIELLAYKNPLSYPEYAVSTHEVALEYYLEEQVKSHKKNNEFWCYQASEIKPIFNRDFYD